MGRGILAVTGAALLGCSAGDPYGQGAQSGTAASGRTGGGRAGAAAGSSSGSMSFWGGTSAGATGGSGTSGSSDCRPWGGFNVSALTDCAPGTVEAVGLLLDDCLGLQPLSTPFVVSDLDHPGQPAIFDGCGQFHFCLPPGETLRPSINLVGYLPLNLVRQRLSENIVLCPRGGVSMICQNALSALNLPGLDMAHPSLLIEIEANGLCDDYSGFSFQLYLPEGGGPLTVPAAYLNGGGVASGAAATTDYGVEILYDLPDTVDQLTIRPSRTFDAGSGCIENDDADVGIDQPIEVTPGYLTVVPWLMP